MIKVKHFLDAVEQDDGQRLWVEPIGLCNDLREWWAAEVRKDAAILKALQGLPEPLPSGQSGIRELARLYGKFARKRTAPAKRSGTRPPPEAAGHRRR